MIVAADFAGYLVAAAVEAAKVNLLGRAIAAAAAAVAIFVVAVNEAVLKVPVVTIVVIVAAVVSSVTGSAVKTEVGFAVNALVAAAAAVFVKDLIVAPFVAETVNPLVVMSTASNSC